MNIADRINLIGPRLLVLRDKPAEATVGGLVIPDVAKREAHKIEQGVVLRVGPGKLTKKGALLPISAAPGDRVVFGFLDGEDIVEGGREYVILEDEDVRAIFV